MNPHKSHYRTDRNFREWLEHYNKQITGLTVERNIASLPFRVINKEEKA